MGNEFDNKFTWVIENFSSLESDKIYSNNFLAGGCKWHVIAYPKEGNKVDYLSLYLKIADYESLPSGWRRHARFCLSIVDQNSEVPSHSRVTEHWFDQNSPDWGFKSMIPFTKLHANKGGFMLNGEVKIVAEVDVLQVIGKSDVLGETKDEIPTPKKFKPNDDDGAGAASNDLLNKTQQVKESIDVNGFQVLPSQVESVRRIFERHLDFASKFRPKKRHLKSSYMNVILGLIETLCQLPEELSDDDLNEASVALSYVANGGFKVEWLSKQLKEVNDRRKKVHNGMVRVQQMENKFQKLNQECLDLKSLLEKEKADVSAANVALSFDDFV